MMRLKKISLLKERRTRIGEYPFNIPSIASLDTLDISSRVCFFVGENGTGKSTLLEAIAAHYGFGLEGGNRNFSPKTTESVTTIEPLVKALRLSFTKRTGGGFYLRAESFFNVARYVDQVGASGSYGDKASMTNRMENRSYPYCKIASLAPVSISWTNQRQPYHLSVS